MLSCGQQPAVAHKIIALAKEAFKLGPRGKAPKPLTIRSNAIRFVVALLVAAVIPCGARSFAPF